MRRRLSAVEREELKYAHLVRRETAVARRNRERFAVHAAGIGPGPVHEPAGPRLELSPRYRGVGRPLDLPKEMW